MFLVKISRRLDHVNLKKYDTIDKAKWNFAARCSNSGLVHNNKVCNFR